ncbi:MAG TPA: hypothetical protein VFN02_00330, partial [Ktedonobacteraceae bacterium]|nr:hypothetical protein [Ktedonobacteraceae bacterium]
MPDETGKLSPSHFSVMTSDDLILGSIDSAIQISMKQQGIYIVDVPAEYTKAEFVLRAKDKSSSAKIPFSVPLPTLRWALVEGQHVVLQNANWQTKPSIQPRAWLDQADVPRVLVSLTSPRSDSIILSGQLLVHYSKEHPPQVLSPRGNIGKWLTFNLAEATDSIR